LPEDRDIECADEPGRQVVDIAIDDTVLRTEGPVCIPIGSLDSIEPFIVDADSCCGIAAIKRPCMEKAGKARAVLSASKETT
jgi:hypothetical protein